MADEAGTEPMLDVPYRPSDRRRWACTRCGGERVEVDLTRPSIDPAYAIGTCLYCPTKGKGSRSGGQPVYHRQSAILRRVR